MLHHFNHAGVAELAYAADLKSAGSNPVRVQVPPPALVFLKGGNFMAKRNYIPPLLNMSLGKPFIQEAENIFGTGFDFNRTIHNLFEILQKSDTFSTDKKTEFQEEINLFSKLLQLHLQVIKEIPKYPYLEYYDWLGELYEALGIMSKSKEQFFTPTTVANAMSKMISPLSEKLKNPQEDTLIEVLDPACGSGRLLLSYAKTVKSEIGDYALNHILFWGIDLDMTAFELALLNMILWNLNAIIIHGDSLTFEVFDAYIVMRNALPIKLGLPEKLDPNKVKQILTLKTDKKKSL